MCIENVCDEQEYAINKYTIKWNLLYTNIQKLSCGQASSLKFQNSQFSISGGIFPGYSLYVVD